MKELSGCQRNVVLTEIDMNYSNLQMLQEIALRASNQSRCERLKVGCALTTKRGSYVYGYNHMKDGSICEETPEKSKENVVHAEIHALSKAALSDIESMYVTHSPCLACAIEIVKRNVGQVFYSIPYRSDDGLVHLMNNGVIVTQIPSLGV